MNQAAEVFGFTNSRELIAKLAKKDDDKPIPAKDKGKVASTSNAVVTTTRVINRVEAEVKHHKRKDVDKVEEKVQENLYLIAGVVERPGILEILAQLKDSY